MGKFKKGVRVRLTEEHDGGGPDVGALGTVFAKDIGKGRHDVIWDGLEDGHDGEASDGSTNHWYVPKSKLEVVEDEPAKRFTIGDRATALDGEQVTIDSEIDDVDHVWVVNADGKRWRTPASWLSDAWVPKVGDRVRMHETSTWYNDCTMTVGTVVSLHDDGARFYARFDGDDFDWCLDVEDVYLTDLPAAAEAQPAVEAEPEFVPFTVGQRIRCDDDLGAIGHFTVGDFYTVKSVEGDDPSNLVWVEEVEAAMCAYRFSAAPLTIQVGRYYKTRDGRKVLAERARPSEGFAIRADGNHYDANGKNIYGATLKDLVAEWVDEPVVAVEAVEPAPKFKVGDRVRHVDLSYVGEIKEVRTDGYYKTFWPTEGWGGTDPESDLELITDEPAVAPAITGRPFQIGDRVKYVGKHAEITSPERLGWVGTIKSVLNDTVEVDYDNGEWGNQFFENVELVTPAPANDNVSIHTLTLTLNSEPLADAFRTIAAALNQAADSIGKAA